jgi:hypothetical protein
VDYQFFDMVVYVCRMPLLQLHMQRTSSYNARKNLR